MLDGWLPQSGFDWLQFVGSVFGIVAGLIAIARWLKPILIRASAYWYVGVAVSDLERGVRFLDQAWEGLQSPSRLIARLGAGLTLGLMSMSTMAFTMLILDEGWPRTVGGGGFFLLAISHLLRIGLLAEVVLDLDKHLDSMIRRLERRLPKIKAREPDLDRFIQATVKCLEHLKSMRRNLKTLPQSE